MTEKLDKIERVVTRKGKRVEVVHVTGGRASKPIVYELLSYAKAKLLEKHANQRTGEYPVEISLVWRDYLVREPAEEQSDPKPT